MKKAILKTLAYADIFDYPLKEKEIERFLIAEKPTPNINQALKEITQVSQKNDLFFLKGRDKIAAIRKKRQHWSQEKLEIAKKVSRWLKLIPTVKMVAVTGALAMNNSKEGDDIDLFIVTSANRLWLSRGLVVTFLRTTGLYWRPGKIKNKICPNMLLDEKRLGIPKKEQDLFSAHEVCQLKPIWDKKGTYQKFIQKNKWVKQYLPNWKP